MAEKDMTNDGVDDTYVVPQAPSREEAAAGAILTASQTGARPDAIIGNGGVPQHGVRLEQLDKDALIENPLADNTIGGGTTAAMTNDPSKPPIGPGSGAPKIEAPRQSSGVATSKEEAWTVSDGADVPDSDAEKEIVQAERVGTVKPGKDGIAVPTVNERIVYSDGSVANIYVGQDDPFPERDVVVHTKGSVPAQPNQEAQAELVAETGDDAEAPEPAKKAPAKKTAKSKAGD